MGVIIGLLKDGDAPCVETNDSPQITISPPRTHPTTVASCSSRYGNAFDLADVRDVEVKRKFVCKKSDIGAVMQWLGTLSGGTSVTYNAGADGTKTMAGVFNLTDKMTFSSVSPSFAEVEARFVGQVLDVNFLLPSGLTFNKVTDTKYSVKIGTEVVAEFESSAAGDGSGITIAPGDELFWNDLPAEIRAIVPETLDDIPTVAEDVPSASPYGWSHSWKWYMLAYRQIFLKINGEIAKTWYIPTLPVRRRRKYWPKAIYFGVTDAEFNSWSKSMPKLYGTLDLSQENDRLVGMPLRKREYTTVLVAENAVLPSDPPFDMMLNETGSAIVTGSGNPKQVFHQVSVEKIYPSAKPAGEFYVVAGTEDYKKNGYWIPEYKWSVRWPEPNEPYYFNGACHTVNWGANPYTYKHYGLVGYAFKYEDEYAWGSPADALVTVKWTVEDGHYKLLAIGADGIENTLIDWTA